MSGQSSPQGFLRREELRGLFALGLLAVVASIRIQKSQIIWTVNEKPFDVTIFFDAVLMFWSFYAFFMVLGLSQDIIGDKFSAMFRSLSTYYLYFSFIIIGFLACLLYYLIYPTRAPWSFVFILSIVGYFALKRLYLGVRKLPRAWQPLKSEMRVLLARSFRRLKTVSYQFLLSGASVCYILVVLGTKEEVVIPATIIGSILLVCFLLARDLLKKSDSDSPLDY